MKAPTIKFCGKCKADKPIKQFPLQTERPDGHGSWCKQCKSAYHKRRYIEAGQKNYMDKVRAQAEITDFRERLQRDLAKRKPPEPSITHEEMGHFLGLKIMQPKIAPPQPSTFNGLKQLVRYA